MKKSIVFIFILLCLSSSFAWLDNNYGKRRLVNVTVYSNVTEHQLYVNVSYDSDMQADWDDIKFGDLSDNNLYFWLQEKVNSDWAEFWFRGNWTTDNLTQAYIYYDYASASSSSDGTNTFESFDDFDDDSFSGWTLISGTNFNTVESGGWVNFTQTGTTGNIFYWKDDLVGGNYTMFTEMLMTDDSDSQQIGLTFINDSNNWYIGNYVQRSGSDDGGRIARMVGGVWKGDQESILHEITSNSESVFFNMTRKEDTFQVGFNIPDDSYVGITSFYSEAGLYPTKAGLSLSGGGGASGHWYAYNYFAVRKWTENQPTVEIGAEESKPVTGNEISLNTPTDDGEENSLTVEFNYTPLFRTGNIANCSLWTNETSWSEKEWNASAITNNSVNSISEAFSSYDIFKWTITCWNSTNRIWASENRSVDIVPVPSVSLNFPTNGGSATSGSILFNYTPVDGVGFSSAALWINISNSTYAGDKTATNAIDSGGGTEGKPVVYDFDGDGVLDMVTPELGAGVGNPYGGAYYFKGNASKASLFEDGIRIAYVGVGSGRYGVDWVELGDIDGDNIKDVILGTEGNFVSYLLTNRSEPATKPFNGQVNLTIPSEEADYIAFGLNTRDIFVSAEPSSSGNPNDTKIYICRYNASEGDLYDTCSLIGWTEDQSDCGVIASPGDLNGDGEDDAVTYGHETVEPNRIILLLSNVSNDKGYNDAVTIFYMDAMTSRAGIDVIDDLNDDGINDIIVASQNDTALLLSNTSDTTDYFDVIWIIQNKSDVGWFYSAENWNVFGGAKDDLFLYDRSDWNNNDGNEVIWFLKYNASESDYYNSPEKVTLTGGTVDGSAGIPTNVSGGVDFVVGGRGASQDVQWWTYKGVEGGWVEAGTNASAIVNNTINSIDYSITSLGTRKYNVLLTNTHGKTDWGDENFTFTVSSAVNTEPTFLNAQANNTTPYVLETIRFSSIWQDAEGNLSHYIFSWNASGSWANDSAVAFLLINNSWSNITTWMQVDYEDDVIGWRFWANDTDNEWNQTGIQMITVLGNPPRFYAVQENISTIIVGNYIKMSSFWEDIEGNLSYYIFSWNHTGTWTNDTSVAFSEVNNSWSNITKIITNDTSATIGWRTWANDTSGDWNVTGIQNLIITPFTTSGASGSVDFTTVTITWTTNNEGNSSVSLDYQGTYTNTSANATSHSITITNFLPATLYTFIVKSCDVWNNCDTTTETFATLSVGGGGGGGGDDGDTPENETVGNETYVNDTEEIPPEINITLPNETVWTYPTRPEAIIGLIAAGETGTAFIQILYSLTDRYFRSSNEFVEKYFGWAFTHLFLFLLIYTILCLISIEAEIVRKSRWFVKMIYYSLLVILAFVISLLLPSV